MGRLTVASLNTRGLPLLGSELRARYAAIGAEFEASTVDVANLQEVHTYYHLRRLRRSMPSYRFASFRRSVAGPAGGLLTLSRHPVSSTTYRRFPATTVDTAGLPRRTRLTTSLKGALLTRLTGVTVINTHLSANRDGDWSATNRHYALHQAQLTALMQYVTTAAQPAVVSGDFNIARNSRLYSDFIQQSGLTDAFGDTCPPTFHQAYLNPDQSPHCIDFLLLASPTITVDSATLTFTDQVALPNGPAYATDHLGLEVHLTL
ncbi:MAG TPA: endonuclease/exonuclease/phosphatase family protein [Kribbella sp.]|nr:endonuclease/exonuclease/phosphatase family protein [Kribbella sp.]